MYSKKKLWSNFRLLVDTANKEIEKKLLTRRSYPQQHFKNLYGSSSIMNLGCLKSPLIESKKLKTKDPPNPNWSIMNFGCLKSPLIESEKLKTNDPPNPNGSSSIMKFCCLKSPLIESEKLKTKDPPNPNWSSSILNFGCLKSPLVESEKLKTNDPPNPNGSSLIMNFGCLQSPLVESEKLKTNDPPSPNGSSSIMNFGCLKSPLVESEKTKTKEPPNPNDDKSSSPSSCLTEITSRKRRAENQRKSKGGFKKAKIGPLLFVERKIPDWIFQVMRNINGDVENPRMLFERTLTESDVKSSQSRLLIPFSMLITEDFLTPEEARAINKEENKQEDENVGVGTIVVNERSQKWGLRLKIWSMEKKKTGKGTLNYALNWGWNEVVEGNNLKAMDKICLWTFRCRGVLCFALDLLERVNSIDQ